MKKLIFLVLLIMGGLYFYQIVNMDRVSPNREYTVKEKNLINYENSLSLGQHFSRFTEFKNSVEKAKSMRISEGNYLKSDQIPPMMKQAIIATEDKRFMEHGPIDGLGLSRAILTNLIAGKTLEGGSTITQQLVKNLFLSSERVLSRKLEEIALAFCMEHYYEKDEILTIYLNSIYYGHNAYGLKEAAKIYFHKEAKDLTIGEIAMLAGLPQAPSYYDPYENPKGAKSRRNTVLSLMYQQGLINKSQYDEAISEEILK